jgi:hypothetical protein
MFRAGLNLKAVSCCTVNVCPKFTGVTPSASRTVPFDGKVVTVTVRAAEPKSVSTGAAMPIAVAKLFSETNNDVELWLSTASTPLASAPEKRMLVFRNKVQCVSAAPLL